MLLTKIKRCDAFLQPASIYSHVKLTCYTVGQVTITLSFSEHIQAGTGNIVLTPSGGNGANAPVNIPSNDGQALGPVLSILVANSCIR